jgi:sulfur relay (sulfurtransferase) complex TusBCD TusD component (DsrE family)
MSKKIANICILLASSPGNENRYSLIKITEAALDMGHNVQIFLMSDGVYHLLSDDFMSLVDKGATIALCAHNALERGLDKRPGVLFGSQYDLSTMVAESDTFLSFH